ncbi:MAG: putative quinol monooxygenase [Luteibaculum sp.]
MLRIVKMEFKPDCVSDFINMFESKKDQIGAFEGCSGVRLLRDKQQSNVFFTYSHWQSPEKLENYRNSQLFKSTWSLTKTWFNAKPMAWSVEVEAESENYVSTI